MEFVLGSYVFSQPTNAFIKWRKLSGRIWWVLCCVIGERNLKQLWLAIQPISTKPAITSDLKSLNTKSGTTTYDARNPGPGLEQVQKHDRVRSVLENYAPLQRQYIYNDRKPLQILFQGAEETTPVVCILYVPLHALIRSRSSGALMVEVWICTTMALQNRQQYGCQTGNKLKKKSRDLNRNSSRNKNETMFGSGYENCPKIGVIFKLDIL